MKKWTLNSWRDYPVKHIPKYEDEKELAMVLRKVSSFPPLVFAGETRALKNLLLKLQKAKLFFYKEEIVLKVLQNFILTTSEILLKLFYKWL